MAAPDLTFQDFNGATFQGTGEGEDDSLAASTTCWVVNPIPAGLNETMDWEALTANQQTAIGAFMSASLWGNFHKLSAIQGADAVGGDIAFKISYIRTIVISYGLANPDTVPAAKHCLYNNAAWLTANDDIAIPAGYWVPAKRQEMSAWIAQFRPKFRSLVSIVAWMFRARGHHWTADLEQRYESVWRNCQYADMPTNVGISWRYAAREALHVIFPIDLDDCWLRWADSNTIAGALKKRINTYAAGTAIIAAVDAGMRDLKMAVPVLVDKLAADDAYLELLKADLAVNRWSGSVNFNRYGAPRLRIDEARLGTAAAVILAMLDQFTQRAPLSKSAALKRVATNAPITSAMLAAAVAGMVQKDPAAMLMAVVNP